jgi:hypothetical protein
MPAGSTVEDLMHHLEIPAEERGVTFVNGNLAALPGLEADLDVLLCTVTAWASPTARACGRSSVASALT